MVTFFLLLGTESLSAQGYDYYSTLDYTKSSANKDISDKRTSIPFSAKIYNYHSPYGYSKSSVRQNIVEKHGTKFDPSYSLKAFSTSTGNNSQSSLWEEMGYVLAMETVFTGMSYLGSRKNTYGPAIAGCFDLFMGLAGLQNASKQKSGIQTTGYYLISGGFIAKSLYNFRFGKSHSKNTRFTINFIGFNVLVFTGYFLDTLN